MATIVTVFCLLAVIVQLDARPKSRTLQCVNEISQLYRSTSICINKLTNIGKSVLPAFFQKRSRKRCWGYLNFFNPKSPFPTVSLTTPIALFNGANFYQKTHDIFLRFMLATEKILKDANTTHTGAIALVKDMDFHLDKVLLCLHTKSTINHQLPKRQYDTTAHKTSVKKCLKRAKTVVTARRIQLVQYKDLMEELYFAVTEVKYVVARLTYV